MCLICYNNTIAIKLLFCNSYSLLLYLFSICHYICQWYIYSTHKISLNDIEIKNVSLRQYLYITIVNLVRAHCLLWRNISFYSKRKKNYITKKSIEKGKKIALKNIRKFLIDAVFHANTVDSEMDPVFF